MYRAINIYIATVICLILTGTVHAQQDELKISNAAVRKEVISMIDGQLKAFREHKLDLAFSFASRSLRSHLPQDLFMNVAKQNYPEIWNNKSGDYGIVKDNKQRGTIQVRVVAQDGSNASYDYDLVFEDGSWKIQGILRHQQKKTPAA
jgi:Domain of unknown function (DUF4864)